MKIKNNILTLLIVILSNISTFGQRPCGNCTPVDAALGVIGTVVYGYNVSGNCGMTAGAGNWVASFTGEAGATYHFDLCPNAPGNGSITTNWDPDIKITNAACGILAGTDGSCTAGLNSWQPNDFQWTCTANGTYYIIIAPYFSYTSHTCTGTAANAFTMNYYKYVCPNPPPSNDNCASVTPVALTCNVTTTFTGTGECSTCEPAFNSTCSYKEVWIAFTIPVGGADLKIDFCTSSPVHTNAYINIFPNCAFGTWTSASSWNFTDCPDGNLTLYWTGLPAGNYWYPILIDPAWETPYTVHVTPICCVGSPPTNDNCASVTPVALTCNVPTTFTGTGECSTCEPAFNPACNYKEVWIAFNVPTSGNDLKIDFCTSSPVHDNAYINIFPNCAFGSWTTASSWDWTSCGDGNLTLYWTNVPAGDYWYPILIDPAWQTPYTVHVTPVCCVGSPPANDNCASATPVPLTCNVPTTFTGTGECSTCEPAFNPACNYKEVWIAFNVPTSGNDLKIDFCTSSPIHDNAYINIFPNCAFGSWTTASSWDWTSCGDGNLTLYWTNVPAGDYWYPILIDPAWQTPYTVHVTPVCCLGPIPPNDDCEDMTPVPLVCNTTSTFTGTGECASCETSFNVFCSYKDVWISITVPPTATSLSIDFCTSNPVHDNAYINIFPNCSFASWTTASSWDWVTCGDGNLTLFWNGLAPGNYWYPILISPAWETPYTVHVKATCPLPIELLSFTGKCDGDMVNLNWSTASETNNDYFTLEKSNDAATWKLVKKIKGAGNSNQKLDYFVTDNISENFMYYSLMHTDFDGKNQKFSPIFVNCAKSSSPISIHPNPVSGLLYIETGEAEISETQLLENNGKILYNGNEKIINMASYTPGLYFIKIITTDGDVFFEKVIKE